MNLDKALVTIMAWPVEAARRVGLVLVAAAGLPCTLWEAGALTPWAVDWAGQGDGRMVRLLVAPDGEWQLLLWGDGDVGAYPTSVQRGVLDELLSGHACEILDRFLLLAGAPWPDGEPR